MAFILPAIGELNWGDEILSSLTDLDTRVTTLSSSSGLNQEQVEDLIGTKIVPGSNVTVTYNDTTGITTISTTAGLNQEQVEDLIGTKIVPGSNVSIIYDDVAGTTTISASGSGSAASPIDLTEISTPTTPAAGHSKLYPKADGRYYTLDDAGVEQLVGQNARTLAQASVVTLIPEVKDYEAFALTAQAVGLTIANHVDSVPQDFERFQLRIFSAAAQAITHGSNYVSGGPPLPTTTVASKEMTLGYQWNARISKFDLIASLVKP